MIAACAVVTSKLTGGAIDLSASPRMDQYVASAAQATSFVDNLVKGIIGALPIQ
jgi:hypothetical protein